MIAQLDSAYLKARPLKAATRLVSYGLFEGRPLTTKGRWINPVVFALLGLAKRIPVTREVRKPIFIVGTGRSGTTILGVVLSMHRDVGFLNEPKAIWHAALPYEDVVGSYSDGEALYRLTESDASPTVTQAIRRIYSTYLLSTGTSRLCDKYPELIFRVPFVRAIFPDAQFLFLIRNGWDTCHSIDQWSQRLGFDYGTETHDWWGVDRRKWRLLVEQLVPDDPDLAGDIERIRDFDRGQDMAAVEWILSMKEGIRRRDEYPDAFHTVSFERLSTNPASELKAILDFCELEEDRTFAEYAAQTMHPLRAKQPFALDPCLRAPFDRVMRDLGYT